MGAAVPNEAELAGVEEARPDALEVAQEEDAPPEARTEDAAAVGPWDFGPPREKRSYGPLGFVALVGT